MNINLSSDTIAAIGTAPGLGGIGIIRISGELALKILQKMFTKKSRALGQNLTLSPDNFNFTPFRLEHGWIIGSQSEPLDEVMAVFMKGPSSYTGEDAAEIQCHGGRAVLEAVLKAVLNNGARLAEDGEFTRRAYLNGRLNLTQAEAVAEIIDAPTLEAVYLARNKLEGKLEKDLESLRTNLDWLRSRLYLAIDFPDEAEDEAESGGFSDAEFKERISHLKAQISSLIASYERSKLWREGALAVLAGQVNSGKSSILNAILGKKRAIVSDCPGTTRDFIEENVNFAGLMVRLTDTAGLRATQNQIEEEGIRLAQELAHQADVILLVLDASKLLTPDNLKLLGTKNFDLTSILDKEDARLVQKYTDKIFILLNKVDLLSQKLPAMQSFAAFNYQALSALLGEGIDELSLKVKNFLIAKNTLPNFASEAAPNLRQRHKLEQVLNELSALENEFASQIPAELLSVRLDSIANYLMDIIGTSGTEDILDQVFANFCLGK